MTAEYENFLAHHGIKGQKWGQRRFQNEDGSLTQEGKARYYKDEGFARNVLGGDFGLRAVANRSEERMRERADINKRLGQKERAEMYRQYAEAQKQASEEMKAYREKTSTAKLIVQNSLLTPVGGHMYRQARARGDKFMSALLQGGTGVVGYAVSAVKSKKKYGKATI